ncbi:NAD(P)-dependent oxidoreductase [Streptomyces luteoverticillatus]|uniref:NAD(P)-dependent oxidoreductase n=1 Tax=Streptomyces luteoverticillatus TaxID=66425 RepID=A0A3Q9FZ10_STRLT|nr:NAD(P)-binding domain-containing protein [Streptomyces luteoverticillatus]AZQ73517.1 NAD(P)-dependent oxidoreductase [Streptomyces luteoverticillatus]
MTSIPVTVLGLGPMGRALASAFLAQGHPTTVWNRSPGKADELTARGAVEAKDVADAVAASPLVIVCVLDYDAVREILAPATDALRGRALVNLTADTPDRARAMAAWAAGHGIDYLDGSIMTPTVTIGTDQALVLYSGPEDVWTAHRAALASLGGTADHLGTDPGRASAYDVALLDLFWTTVSGYVHALALARAENVSGKELAPYALGITGLMSRIIPRFAEAADEGRHPGDEAGLATAAAGMAHVIHAAEAHGLDTGVMAAAHAVARRAVEEGYGADGISRLVEVLGREAPNRKGPVGPAQR